MEVKYIEKLPVERWEEFKNLRIENYKNDPNAFSGNLKDIVDQDESEWKKKLENNINEECIWIFAEHDNKLIGAGYVYFYKDSRFKHNSSLQGLYVSPHYRNKGIGESLITRRIELISKNTHIKNIICEIYGTQIASIELHKKMGFEISGLIKDFVLIEDKYFDLLQFCKKINN